MDGSGSATIHWRDLNKTLNGRLRECHNILERSLKNVIWTAQGLPQHTEEILTKRYMDGSGSATAYSRDKKKTLYGRLRECHNILERSKQNVIWTAQGVPQYTQEIKTKRYMDGSGSASILERSKQNVIWTAQGVPQHTGEI